MAAIGKIRSWSVFLVGVIAFALFAFIAEELFRSCESTRNEQRQQIGEVYGEKMNVQDFQKLVDEYTEVMKMQQGSENLSEAQQNQVKDMVWNSYVQSKMVEHEAKALGLTVTDAEMQDLLNKGTNPMLMQTPFVNQQTGRFDASALKKFIADYKANKNPQLTEQYERIYKYWTFMEKTIRQQLLAQKYQALLASTFLSNPVEAKMAFEEENTERSIQLASFPYSSIADDKVEISESDLKAKYNELKDRFMQPIESRDIKYVAYEVNASVSDRAALNKEFAAYFQDMTAAADPSEIVRKSTSTVSYLGAPVVKDAYPQDIAARLDSMAVGQTFGPSENKADNTLNIIKLMAKVSLPDSVQIRQIQIGAATVDEAHRIADSVYTALEAGADFEALAKKYNQTGEKVWITAQQIAGTLYQANTPDQKKMVAAIRNSAVNTTNNVVMDQGNIILQVLDRRHFSDNYQAAVIKRTIDFSRDTYRSAYNKFSSFVSANTTLESMEKNAAKAGYTVQESKDVTTAQHYVANIRATRDALKWIFEAGEGEMSKMYECGDNNTLLVIVLNKIHKAGFRGLDDEQVKELVKAEVLKDKKAEQIIAKLQGVNSIAAAKAKGATVAPVEQITFAAPVFIAATGSSEPALSGAVSATAKGKFSAAPVKGNAGVYLFQVNNVTKRPAKFDEKAYEQTLRQRAMQNAGNFMNELYLKANVKDNRYLFF